MEAKRIVKGDPREFLPKPNILLEQTSPLIEKRSVTRRPREAANRDTCVSHYGGKEIKGKRM